MLSPDDPGNLPPSAPPTRTFEGPWFETQLFLSTAIGVISFLLFSYARPRWPLLFAPRTKLKGFSPHEAHAHQAFLGWIMPTIRTSEFAVLQIVGLDAAVLLNFLKMAFYLFFSMSVLAVLVLMPVNFKSNVGGNDDDDNDWPEFVPAPSKPSQGRDWLDLLNDANSYLSLHLAFAYLFTFLALRSIYKNYNRFIRARQLFSLELVHSIAARTVLITNLPNHLRGERALAVYFEKMGLTVESVTVSREVSTLKRLLDTRTEALLNLEKAWVTYLGNPSTAEVVDPASSVVAPLVDVGDQQSSLEQQAQRVIVPHRKRPTLRVGWFKKVDALEYLESRFKEADEAVRAKRRNGRFRASHAAFVTFEKMSSAQIAAQTVHCPAVGQCSTQLAPEPRDIVWANMAHSQASERVRHLLVFGVMCLIFLFWLVPTAALASLLSYKEIKKTMPWLGRLIDSNEQIRAIVQNVLPSVAMISINAMLPFVFEALTYMQGYRARSWIEYSLMRKYFLFLLVNVVFIFLLASTYWQLIRDLAESPAKVPEKLATALQQGRAKHFFLSYVILQGLGIMPLQLLNLGDIVPRMIYRIFLTRTPRDFAELNAPPMINYGVVYPQAILIFVVTMLYSVIQPIILIFGSLYFGIGYFVYKYKLLFVFYKPYESQGQAWPITFNRLVWGIMIFQIFMTGIFLLKKGFILASLMVPLLVGTFFWSMYTFRMFDPLSNFVNLSSVFEVQRGEESEEIVRLREGHPVTWSQSNLNRRRYAQNDETLYVAPEDERTDYSQPPMSNWYNGVLNTGKRRYGHPALTGILPQPWLPIRKGQSLVNREANGHSGGRKDEAVVLTLRKRYSTLHKHRGRNATQSSAQRPADVSALDEAVLNPWSDDTSTGGGHGTNGRGLGPRRLSFDGASGVIALPDDSQWLMEDINSESDDSYGEHDNGMSSSRITAASSASEGASSDASATPRSKRRHGTYYHHPERRRPTIVGSSPQS